MNSRQSPTHGQRNSFPSRCSLDNVRLTRDERMQKRNQVFLLLHL